MKTPSFPTNHAGFRPAALRCLVLVLALLSWNLGPASPAAAESSVRCGGRIVQTGMYKDQVVSLCGQPVSTQTRQKTLRADYWRAEDGTRVPDRFAGEWGEPLERVQRGRAVEDWYYDMGVGRLKWVFTFSDNRLVDITPAR